MLWFPFCKAIWNLFSFSVFFPDSYLWSNLKGNCNLNNDQERICCNLNIVSLASDETNIFTQNHRIWAWMKCDRVGFVNPPAQSRLSSHRSPRIMCRQICNISMDRDCTASLSSLLPVFDHPYNKLVFCVHMEFPDFFLFCFSQFVPITITELYIPPLDMYAHWWDLLHLLFSGLNTPTSLCLCF